LGAFNLFLPIFPMDGGRVLRSMLGMVTTRLRATKLAVAIGQVFLAVFIFFAIMVGSIWLIAIAVFLFIAGLSELKLTELSDVAERIDLHRIIKTDFIVLSPDLKVRDLLKVAVPWQSIYPVLDESGNPIGMIDLNDLVKNSGKVGDVMLRGFPVIKESDEKSEVLTKVFSKGYALVVDKKGRLYGILTLDSLQKSIRIESLKKK
jgi:hypothetical protein